jgi:hypothetical protein
MASIPNPTASESVDDIVRAMLTAQEKEDFEAFTSRGTGGFKEALKKSVFFAVCEKVSVHLARGYKLEFLAELDQKKRLLYVWKLTFDDQAGEVLVRLWLSPEREVSGIMLDGANSLYPPSF